MTNNWQKRGIVFSTPSQLGWGISHAALPVVDHIAGDRYRVYFSARDDQNRAQISFFELALADPGHLLRVSDQPVFGLGELGTFDDHGVTSACLVNHGTQKYLYYSGWTRGITVPFYFYVGLAVSNDRGETFQRVSASPVLERNAIDPYLTASPSILVENGIWRMWYVSCTGWKKIGGAVRHYYHIKYAESQDGISWKRSGIVCIDYKDQDEYAIARPVVKKQGGVYNMWFSHRGSAYRIGYATSVDGIHWERRDEEIGIDVSATGWDSDMIAYADVIEHSGVEYMFYNGNGYGASGIGLATRTETE